ncbi:MAG: tetratricopeptide repeat protein [Anaerolineae bacterium]|jgi:tetratricopeptide (TPR) repeat protein
MSLIGRRGKWVLSRLYRRLADAHRHFGNLYGNANEHHAAVENYTRAVLHDPAYTLAFFSRGVIYWRELGHHQRAIQDLTRVLELDPGWSEAYFNRAIAYRMTGQLSAAIADLERYLVKGSDEFWLVSAERQLAELRQEMGEGEADAAES